MFFWACVALNRFLPQRGVPILLYHSLDESGSLISTHPENFQWQMHYLHQRGWRTLRLDELLDAHRAGALPRKRFVVTFDDGFQNVLAVGRAILGQYNFTAAVYLATDFVGGSNAFATIAMPRLPMLSWQEARMLREAGWDIGSHGCTHRNLTELSESEVRRELHSSYQAIAENLGAPVRHFCYPRGRHTPGIARAVEEAGYRSAVSLKRGLVHPSSNPWMLERLPVNDRVMPWHFQALLTESYSWFAGVRAAL